MKLQFKGSKMKKIVILSITLLVLGAGFLSGCSETDQNTNSNTTNSDGTNENITLWDGTKVTGNTDKIEIINYSVETQNMEREKIADGFTYTEEAFIYIINVTAKSIAAEILDEVRVTAKFYDNSGIYLESDFGGVCELTLGETFGILLSYNKNIGNFEYVDHIKFEILVT